MTRLKIRELNEALGAEIEGLDSSGPLSDEEMAQLRAAFYDRGVLVFRNSDFDEDYQRYLVYSLIGEEPPVSERKEPMLVSNKAKDGAAPYGRLLYHCDAMWSDVPQRVVSLYGVAVEPPNAPTIFISMEHAWNTLPEHLRERVKNLEARHGFDEAYPNRGGDADVLDGRMTESRSTIRPVAFRHPQTGRELLYISQQATIEIMGLEHDENEALLEELFEHIYKPESVLSHDWRTGDFVVWDNIATQHGRGTVALNGPVRTLRKVIGPMPMPTVRPTYSKAAAGS
jgi:alpha-ketoglutarate-dependent taurine dioxygenase